MDIPKAVASSVCRAFTVATDTPDTLIMAWSIAKFLRFALLAPDTVRFA